MVRLLRRVLRLGLLAGVGVGILKAVKGRKAPDPWADSWVSTGPPGGTRPSAAPITPAAPKPPAPSSTASAALGTPPPAAPKPPAPTPSGAKPPAATPAPPPPSSATENDQAETASGDADSEEGDRAKAKPPAGRTTKSTRKGPAKKSPTGKAEEPPDERLWVPANDGVCPQSHPVKAKLSSKIFHTPSGRNYSRTKADRCYPDENSAQADGLRPAQR